MGGKLRTLASDTLIYGLSTVVGRFLTFLLTPLYTNFLPSKEEFGRVVYLYTIIGFVNILYGFGADSAFMRFFTPDNDERSRSLFSMAFGIIMLVGGVGTLSCFLLSEQISVYLFSRGDYAHLIRLAALMPLFDAIVIVPYAWLRMKRRSRRFALLKFAAITINVAANWLLLAQFHQGITGVVIAGTLSSAAAAIMILPELLRNIRPVFERKLLSQMLRFSLPTIPSSLSSMMLQVADRPIMMALAGSAAVGLYQANYRLGIPMLLAVMVFEYAWKPFYLSHRDDPDIGQLLSQALVYFTAVCGAIFLAGSLLVEFVVQIPFPGGRLINPSYWSGLNIVPIVLASYFFNGVFVHLSAGFHITKRTGYLPLVTASAAGANVVLNFVLIPMFGITGGAWATFGAYLLSALIAWYYARKIYPVRYDWLRVGITVLITVFGFGVGYLTSSIWWRLGIIALYPVMLVITGVIPYSEVRSILQSRSNKSARG